MIDLLLSSVPVWAWTAGMTVTARRQARRFNRHPVPGVERTADLDYVGDASREHHLDVLRPTGDARAEGLPVYVYFHGGGWTSGDKAAVTKYCASQAVSGLLVVNANYRLARRRTGYRMAHMVEDANRVLGWVRAHAVEFGGDPERIVVGGDSAGGQIAALVVASATQPELAAHFGVVPAVEPEHVRGVVQHCSFADTELALGRWSLGSGFVRMLLPARARGLRGAAFRDAARYLSPVEWLSPRFPETLVTSSVRDFLHHASVTLVDRLRGHGVAVESLILEREERGARHTWQQDAALPESQAVYRRLQAFVARVTALPAAG